MSDCNRSPNEDTSTEDLDRLPSDFTLNESAVDLPKLVQPSLAEPINGEQSQKSVRRNSITLASLRGIVIGALTTTGLLFAFQAEVTKIRIVSSGMNSTTETHYYRLSLSFSNRTETAHFVPKVSKKK
jgi:hypothetical protein